MQKSIVISINPLIRKLWSQYDGDLSISRWLNVKTQKHIISLIDNEIQSLNLFQYEAISYRFKKTDKEIILTFTWSESENINTFSLQAKEDIKTILYMLWSKNFDAFETAI